MKLKSLRQSVSLFIVVLLVLAVFASCNPSNDDSAINPTESISESESEIFYPPISPDELFSNSKKYMCGDASYYYVANEKTENDFLSLLAHYKSNSYIQYSNYSVEGNVFITLTNDKSFAHIGFIPSKKQVTLVESKNAGNKLPETITDESLDIQSVTQIKSTHENGMGYIITLTDLSFIIIDGGYADCAKELNTQLNILSRGQKIIIRSWILSHSHSDHYPCFSKFASEYGKTVTLECVMFGLPSMQDASDKWLHSSIRTFIKMFDGGDSIPTTILHTGMSFSYGKVKLNVLLAAETTYFDGKPANFNESSSVVRIESQKGSAIFLADIPILGSTYLMDIYGNSLKSDIVQVSHHGVEDAPIELYKKIQASVLLWPCDKKLYESNRNGNVKKLLSKLSSTKFEYFHYQGSKTVDFDSLK